MGYFKRTFRKTLSSPSAPHRQKTHVAGRKYTTVDPAAVFEDLLPDLVHGKDGYAWACCPFHDDNNPSLCVNVESGWYKCMSSNCGETGTNIVGFVSHLLGLDYAEARRHLEHHYG